MSFVVRKSGKFGFKVQKQVYENNKKRVLGVPKDTWHQLGFRPDMTIEQAKDRASRLNAERSVDRLKLIRSAKNLQQIEVLKSIYLPEEYAADFQQWLVENVKKDAGDKVMSYWKTAQKVINSVQLLPKDFYSNREKIVNYFARESYSPDYTQKIVRIMNQWTEFVGEKQGQYFRPIPKMTGTQVSKIADSYLDSDEYRGPSDILKPADLDRIRSQISDAQYRWLSFTVWFGLRPAEVETLHDSKFPARIERDDSLGVDVLWVYQRKLKRIARDRRWKGIPAFLPEQLTTLTYFDLELAPPLNKTLQKYLSGHVTKYGGRKGFVDLMLDRKQSLEDISLWMGHQNVDMTWSKYRNKKRVSFTPTG